MIRLFTAQASVNVDVKDVFGWLAAGVILVLFWFIRRELDRKDAEVVAIRERTHKHADALTDHALRLDRLERPGSDPGPKGKR